MSQLSNVIKKVARCLAPELARKDVPRRKDPAGHSEADAIADLLGKTQRKGYVPLLFGPGWSVRAFGGSYSLRDWELLARHGGIFGVRLEEKISNPYAVSFPWPDFGVPAVEDFEHAMYQVMIQARFHRNLYVGCMGGIGRTGTFLACLHKTAVQMHSGASVGNSMDHVAHIRSCYLGHAIETKPQEEFITAWNPTRVLSAIQPLQGL
jgi:hypothetical protein